ncbi:TonB-dependent receptor domain-containing protein [Sphingomonas sp. MMS24-JH45]
MFTAYDPTYKTDELTVQGRVEHNFGGIKAQLTGFYHETSVDSSQDYNLGVANRALIQPALNTLAAAAAGAFPGLPASYFSPIAAALIPNGPTGDACTSLPEQTGLGSFGGFKRCSSVPLAFDRSVQKTKDYSVEGIISSDFDGMFNFLLGGIDVDGKVTNGDYYVNAFAIDYVTGILGTFGALGGGRPPSFLGTPFFRNATAEFRLKSYGIFGETYFDLTDKLDHAGLRYNNDKKYVRSRSTLASFPVPFSQTGSAFDTQFGGNYDADPVTGTCTQQASPAGTIGSRSGCDAFAIRNRTFDEVTGRAVIRKLTDDNLLYASYSRGYKSGGFNPPVQVPGYCSGILFVPEIINAYEVGSKNTFGNGSLCSTSPASTTSTRACSLAASSRARRSTTSTPTSTASRPMRTSVRRGRSR